MGPGGFAYLYGGNITKPKQTNRAKECFVTLILLLKAVIAKGVSTHHSRGKNTFALAIKSITKTAIGVVAGFLRWLNLDTGFQEDRPQCPWQLGD